MPSRLDAHKNGGLPLQKPHPDYDHPSQFPGKGPALGPSTYLHAVAGKGWPYDHKAEDTFDIPHTTPPLHLTFPEGFTVHEEPSAPEYHAEYGSKGEAILVIATQSVTRSVKRIAYFDTYADAQRAAEALNNHEGY